MKLFPLSIPSTHENIFDHENLVEDHDLVSKHSHRIVPMHLCVFVVLDLPKEFLQIVGL